MLHMARTYKKKRPNTKWSDETISQDVEIVIFGRVEVRMSAYTKLQNVIQKINQWRVRTLIRQMSGVQLYWMLTSKRLLGCAMWILRSKVGLISQQR